MRSSPLLRRVGAAPSRALAVAAMLVLLGTSLAPAQVHRTSAATCSLVPQLRDVTINQGLGAYTPLVRGKETLVRWYLSLPACAASGASIRLTGAALRVTRTGLTALIGRPTPALRSPYPLLPPHRQASLLDAPGDPLFVVPGSVLAPAGTTSRFTATFRATINYSARESATATPVTGSITFTKRPGTTTAISATVERRTNALRILVVPMGDISQSYASQFTTAANSSVISGMLTLSRIFPVPQGTGDLGGSVGGVRYAINPGLLDVGRLMTGGTFCGTGSNFNAIKGLLGQYLQTWNTANPDASADRVLGVVDESISRGGSSGCAEGMASVGSAEAWVRATYDRPGTPSATGAVIAMEIAHTLGMVHGSRDDFFSPYHSPNREADPGGNRAYNVGLRSFLVDDRTVMTLSGTWNNTNTLFEAADWAQVLCALGGAATSECSSPGSVGTATGIAAGPRFILSGTVSDDETDPVTSVVESYFSLDVAPTDPDPDSRYRLVQRDETSILRDDGVPVLFTDSNHDDADEAAEHSGLGLFSLSLPFDTDAERVELWRGSPDAPGSELLYARDRTAPPEIVAVEIGPPEPTGELINFTSDASRDDVDPALTDDATWLAWSTFMGVGSSPAMRVAPTSSPGNVAVLGGADPTPASQPAWRPDARALAYAWNGDIFTVTVDTTGSVASFGVPSRIYDHLPEVNLPAFRPTWSPDGTQIAFDAAGDIYRMPATGGTPIRLTTTGDAHSPSWSRTPGDERIVYVRDLRDGAFAPESSPVVYGRMSGSGLVHRPASIDAPRPVGGSQPIAPTSHDEVTETYPVNSTDDEDDGTCDEAHCSLREAINAANAHDNGTFDQDTIAFAIPGDAPYTIQPLTQLPAMTDPVIIDGTTQPGYAGSPVVELDGSLAGTNVYGLDIRAGSSVVRGLTINRFTQAGIIIWIGTGSLVEGNYIGTNILGTSAQPNRYGVVVLSAANRIGSAEPGGGNLISGNNGAGIEFRQETSTGNVVLGNSIGTDVGGTIALPNNGSGISSPASNTIGGTGPDEGNLISGNRSSGLSLGEANVVQGNLVGTDASGTERLGNLDGIAISGADNIIGGTAAGARNVISGNLQEGMTINFAAATDNRVEGNYIGTDITGTVALGNGPGFRGIVLGNGAPNNIIGGTADGAGNVISGNGVGMYIHAAGTSGNRVEGNRIGANATGTASLPNLNSGIVIWGGATDNIIGGTAVGSRNQISGNNGHGVDIFGAGTSGNVVAGNLIGTNSSGSMALSNSNTGIRIGDAASGNTIGGTSPGAGNVISANGAFGLEVRGSDTIVQGNLIGTDSSGTVDLGNGNSGVAVYGANNTVGGTAAGAGNTIAFNSGRGVYVF
ncbi:MAG: CSLREA domain-containing protein, partial [Chloroflexi bacterium]|nr:CSLREA domain-containing protein [Chloroflexota bacterium]